VIFAVTDHGRELLLLVYEADDAHIFTRHIPTRGKVTFRRDGRSWRDQKNGVFEIMSTAALSPADHAAAIGLDRKMREAKGPEDWALSEVEIRLLLNYSDLFRAHPLPEV
jgi:hypothetical protein